MPSYDLALNSSGAISRSSFSVARMTESGNLFQLSPFRYGVRPAEPCRQPEDVEVIPSPLHERDDDGRRIERVSIRQRLLAWYTVLGYHVEDAIHVEEEDGLFTWQAYIVAHAQTSSSCPNR